MKTTLFALVVAAAVGLVSAQNLSGEPACAVTCLKNAISAAGCAANDQGCQCGTGKAAIQTAVTPCLVAACNANDLGIAAKVGAQLCDEFSASGGAGGSATATAPVSTPASASPSAPASSSASGSEGATKTVTAISTSVAPPLTTGPATTGGNGSKNGTTGALSTSGKPIPGSSAGGSGGSSSPSSSSSAAAAPTLIAGIGSFIGLVAGVVAAL